MHDGHAAAEPPKQLPEFQAHVAAAEHKQVLGNEVQFHDRRAIEKWHLLEALQLGHRWTRPGIDENTIRGKGALSTVLQADAHRLGAGEARFPEDQVEIGRLFQALLAAVAKTIDNVALALAHPLHIDANVAGLHTVILAPASEIRDPPAGHHRLRRRATFIDASSAYVASLNERRPHARLCQCAAQRCAALSRANHDRLVVSRCGHRTPRVR